LVAGKGGRGVAVICKKPFFIRWDGEEKVGKEHTTIVNAVYDRPTKPEGGLIEHVG